MLPRSFAFALDDNYQTKSTTKLFNTMNKKEIIQKIIHFVITILTAIATTLGTTSCMSL